MARITKTGRYKGKRPACPKCGSPWHWEQIQGLRLYRQEGRNRVYRVKCPTCNIATTCSLGADQ